VGKARRHVFRADLIADHGETVTITARLNDEIAHAFEAMRDQQWGRPRLKLTWVDPRAYTNVEPARRRLEGDWRNG
jgi:hypothetical protein